MKSWYSRNKRLVWCLIQYQNDRHLGIKWDVYAETYKTLKRRFRDLNEWEAAPCSRVRKPGISRVRLVIPKMPSVSMPLRAELSTPTGGVRQTVLDFISTNRPPVTKTTAERNNSAKTVKYLIPKIIIEPLWSRQHGTGKRGRVRSPEVDPHIHRRLTFNQGPSHFCGEERISPRNGAGPVG